MEIPAVSGEELAEFILLSAAAGIGGGEFPLGSILPKDENGKSAPEGGTSEVTLFYRKNFGIFSLENRTF